MSTFLNPAIVRICAADGREVGVGCLVTRHQVLTCAHVIATALGLPEGTTQMPKGEVKLDFPLLALGRTLTGHVTHWRSERDVAGLHLTDTLPNDARPVLLITTDDLWGHAFRAFGFPAGYDNGVWASGVLRGRTGAGWVQIEDVKTPGYWVQSGFSGTPVWDEQLNGVVGIAVAADTDRVTKAAFMIPARELIEAWPEVAQCALEPDSLEYLHGQLAMLEAAQLAAPDPRRFQLQINELGAAIRSWHSRFERQSNRIAAGLEEQYQQRVQESKLRHSRSRLRRVGQPPLGVTDYFKNRLDEQATIKQLLAQPATRLVSIIGHGGMGKTALACKVLQDLEHHRWSQTDDETPLDGVAYLSTRTEGISLERLFLDCAKLLGREDEQRLHVIWTNPQLTTKNKVYHLLEMLGSGRYVILLDNIEDLLDNGGKFLDEELRLFFEQTLTIFHGTQLLVTSRVALAFQNEVRQFDQRVRLLEGLPVEDGIALLCDLDPNGDYGLRDAPVEQLTEAVEMAHGVPRALEMLAGILANDPFASLAEILQQFYAREDVVEALIEENYKRLDRNARLVIEALAVFRRPVPSLALDYLLEPFVLGLNVPSIIKRLTRTNIVSVDRAAKTIALHPIDQDYTYSQLPEEVIDGPAYNRQSLERRAADYYIQLCTPSETWRSIDDLAPQLVEFEHRVRARDYDQACRILDTIEYDYLFKWGYYTELAKMRLDLVGQIGDRSLRAQNLACLGHNYRFLGQVQPAIQLQRQALDAARELGDQGLEGFTLAELGNAHGDLGQLDRAIVYLEDALSIARKTNNRGLEGAWLGNLGFVYHDLGQVDQAISHFEEALAIAQKTRNWRAKATWLGSLAFVYFDVGQVERAIRYHEKALAIAREIGDRRWEGIQLGGLASAHRAQGQIGHAIKLHEDELAIAREIHDLRSEGVSLNKLGLAYYNQRQIKKALGVHEKALAVFRELENRREKSYCLVRLGKALLVTGKLSTAYECCAEALALDVQWTSFQAALTLGIVLLHQGIPSARDMFLEAITLCQVVLAKASNLVEARYAHATALVGKTICGSQWIDQGQHTNLLIPAVAEYECALETCAAPGVVQDALYDLELIREAGIEGLEPAFELLRNFEYEPDLPGDLPDILQEVE